MTREQWLIDAVNALKPVIKDRTGLDLPPTHVSVGFPSRGGTSTKKRTVGQCWHATTSADNTAHVFISPVLDDSFAVLATLVHELVHVLHPDAGHRGDFIKSAREMGLEKPWTATSAGENLEPVLTRLISDLGEFPHSKITPGKGKLKPQTTRMKKLFAEECGCTARTTQKYIEIGAFACPHGNEMEVSE